MNEFYQIAKLTSAGRDGYIKYFPLVDFDSEVLINLNVYLDFWGKKKKFVVEDIIKIKNSSFIKFLNFEDEREIQLLLEREIFLAKDDAEFFIKDTLFVEKLIGYWVYRNEQKIGVIENTFKTPANYVLEIMTDDKKEILIPYIQNFFEDIDVENRKVMLRRDAAIFDDEN